MSTSPPRRRTQAERVEESTRRLAVAAVELFAEHGFERTTAAQIGERAGYSRAMVRRRYGSKEALLEYLVEHELAAAITPDPGVPRGTGMEQIQHQLDRIVDFIAADETSARAFFVLTFEAAGPIPSLRPFYKSWFARYEAQMMEALQAGQRDGSIRKDLDIEVEAMSFISVALGLGFRLALDPQQFDFVGEVRGWGATLIYRYAPPAANAASASVNAS